MKALPLIYATWEYRYYFSGLNFIKSPERNRLINPNLCNALRMFLQRRFTIATSPFNGCIHHYKAANSTGNPAPTRSR